MIYVNQIGAQDSLVFDGSSFVMKKDGKILLQMLDFAEDFAVAQVSKDVVNKDDIEIVPYKEIENFTKSETSQPLFTKGTSLAAKNYNACVLGLHNYIHKNNFQKVRELNKIATIINKVLSKKETKSEKVS